MIRGLNGRHPWLVACAALFALAVTTPAAGQSTGMVRGQVVDASGKPVGHPIQNPCYGCPTPPPPNLPATMSSSGPPGSSSLFTVGPSGGRGRIFNFGVAAESDATVMRGTPLSLSS